MSIRTCLVGSLALAAVGGCVASAPQPVAARKARLSAVPDDTAAIRDVFVAFFRDCAAGELERARAALVPMKPEVPADYVASRLTRYGRIGEVQPGKIHKVHVAGGKAVLAYWESPTDLDPIYFMQHEGRWRILLSLTTFKKRYYMFSQDDFARFEELESWFDTLRARDLYGKEE